MAHASVHDPARIQEATEKVEKFIGLNWGQCECGDADCPGWTDEAFEIVRMVLGVMTPDMKVDP